ncbi:hypothetical protein R70199_07588 [Paraburkholderia domus]|nr:hypothetical protein R70199_07588 [Paraburkholderia domus]
MACAGMHWRGKVSQWTSVEEIRQGVFVAVREHKRAADATEEGCSAQPPRGSEPLHGSIRITTESKRVVDDSVSSLS